MTAKPECNLSVSLATLVEYWLDELDPAEEDRLDEHLFGCGHCSANLWGVVGVTDGIRTAVRAGAVHVVVSDRFVRRLSAEGLRLREYRARAGGSVLCTVAPDDDLLITRLDAPLAGVDRLDVEYLGVGDAGFERLRDVPFDAAAGEVILAPRMERIRALPETTLQIRLLAIAPAGERIVGEYTFHHRPDRTHERG